MNLIYDYLQEMISNYFQPDHMKFLHTKIYILRDNEWFVLANYPKCILTEISAKGVC